MVSAIYDDAVVSHDDVRWMTYHSSRVLAELSSENSARIENLEHDRSRRNRAGTTVE